MDGAGAGWWDASDMLGEAASAGPVPVADGGGWDMGEEAVEEGSELCVSDRRRREAPASLLPFGAIARAQLGLCSWTGE